MADTEKPSQIDKFRETARALGCDEDKERFEKKLGEIAAHKPANELAASKKKRLKEKSKDKSS